MIIDVEIISDKTLTLNITFYGSVLVSKIDDVFIWCCVGGVKLLILFLKLLNDTVQVCDLILVVDYYPTQTIRYVEEQYFYDSTYSKQSPRINVFSKSHDSAMSSLVSENIQVVDHSKDIGSLLVLVS